MAKLSFKQLPLIAKVAIGVSFLNTWVLFEEIVVDRQGLWRYMPFYRVGEFCVWDLTVGLLIFGGLWWLSTRHEETRA
ncbi:MAG: hypothetical protein ACRD4E_05690 [Bryobacteraceae bacterium]